MRIPVLRGVARWSIVSALVLVLACGPSQSVQTGGSGAPASGAATLDAQPNPVPAGSELGTTTVNWSTGDGSNAQVYVSEDGGSETLFAAGPSGSQQANWVRTGTTYEFRLYAGDDHRQLLRSIKVTRAG